MEGAKGRLTAEGLLFGKITKTDNRDIAIQLLSNGRFTVPTQVGPRMAAVQFPGIANKHNPGRGGGFRCR